MFKKCKENQCLNRQMLEFYSRQFSLLNQIANRCSQTSSQITADQIRESVTLMQKRMLFALDQKPVQEFHDYISDFYEDKLQKIRKDLNKQIRKTKQLQIKVEEQSKQIRSKDQLIVKSKPIDMSTANQNVTLKNELIHSQQLIKQNQTIMQEQNKVIQELQTYIEGLQQKQKNSRVRSDDKIRQLDQVINTNKKTLVALTRQFESQSKRIQKSFREVELMNVSLIEQKDKLQSEIVIKTQEIKLLSKKIYEQTLIINKFERAMEHTESILLEQKIENNRSIDFNKTLKDKLKDIQRQYEDRLQLKAREIKELEDRNIKIESSIRDLQYDFTKNATQLEKATTQLNSKGQALKKIQDQLSQYQQKYQEAQREIKKSQKRDRENASIIQKLQEELSERQEQIRRHKDANSALRNKIENSLANHQKQKSLIKQDLEAEFKNIIDINREVIISLQNKQKENANLSKQYESILSQNSSLSQSFNQLSNSFEQAKKMINKVEQEKQDLDYIRGQLEIKLKHTERKCEQFIKIAEQKNVAFNRNIELEQTQAQLKKLLRQKQLEIEKYKKWLNEQSNKKAVSDKQEAKLLKQQISKKQFAVKQLSSKMGALQQQLRQAQRTHHIQKEKMCSKIKQLQEIIQDRFDLTNRLVDSTIL